MIDFEWGSGVIFYLLYQGIGPNALVGFKLMMLALTLSLLVWAGLKTREPSAYLAAFYALILLALLPSFASTLRSAVFTDFLLALWLYWFQSERQGRATPHGFYVVTMIFWANVHAGYMVGLAWLGIMATVELALRGDAWKWNIRFLLCVAATLVNPFGWKLWWSTARALLITRQGFGEWQAVAWWPEVMAYSGYKLLLLGLAVALFFQVRRHGWARLDRLVVVPLGAFMLLSLTSARHTSFFAIVAGALAPGLFPASRKLEDYPDPLERLGQMALRSVLVIVPLYSILSFCLAKE